MLAPKNFDQCLTAYEIFSAVGVTLEIVFRSDMAMEGIKAALDKYPDDLILAGTVMTRKQTEKAIEIGVSGIVSTDRIPSVVEIYVKHDIMCVPGGWGDVGKQLLQKAELYSCEFEELKAKYSYQWIYNLFPSATDKTNYIELASAGHGPFKEIVIVYTDGLTLKNLSEIIQCDPEGIYCGSALIKAIDNSATMKEEAERCLSVIISNRKDRPDR